MNIETPWSELLGPHGSEPVVVFPEAGDDEVAIRLAEDLLASGAGRPLLLGRREDLLTAAELLGLELSRARFLYPTDAPELEQVVAAHPRKDGGVPLTADHVRARVLSRPLLMACGLVAIGHAQALVAGRRADGEEIDAHAAIFFAPRRLALFPAESAMWLVAMDGRGEPAARADS